MLDLQRLRVEVDSLNRLAERPGMACALTPVMPSRAGGSQIRMKGRAHMEG